MTPLYDSAAIRAAERAAFARRPSFALMRAAGKALAGEAQKMLAGRKAVRVLAAAGPGNNGGDAFVAARLLQKAGCRVAVAFAGSEAKLPPDAARALREWRQSGGTVADVSAAARGKYDLAIDGVFGIGIRRPPQGEQLALIRLLNAAPFPVLAIDAPSGIDVDTGGGGECVRAERTVTFFAEKPGLRTGKGKAAAGVVSVCGLGGGMTVAPCGFLCDDIRDFGFARLRRRSDGHKGDYGTVAVVGGAMGMTGALALASRAAVRLGAGKVFAVALAENAPAFDSDAPEVMWRRAADFYRSGSLFPPVSVVAIGVGLGADAAAKKTFARAVMLPSPLIADADALNILAANPALTKKFAARKAQTVITPHPAEAARMLQCKTEEVQNDRINAAKTLAQKTNAETVLKGAGTVIASPSGEWNICNAGNPGLAQAGAGDVLTGIIAALLAQTADANFSANAGAYLHAAAADQLTKETNGEIGINLNNIATAAAKITNPAI